MQLLIPILSTFLFALVVSLGLVPLFMRIASKIDLVDKPDTTRKLHSRAIPLVGGIVVFISVVLAAIFATTVFDINTRPRDGWELLGLFLACGSILLIGVVDDRFGLRGRQKLLGQILTATILIFFGYSFQSVEFLGYTFQFGIFSFAIVYVWCLAAINSVNLLDGADGIASTIGCILCVSLGIMSFYTGQNVDGILCIAMAGALVGFLYFNFPPAKAYLGDAGSMLIGLFLAAITIRCAFKQVMAYSFFAPVALLAIPLIDTSAAIIRRRLTGRSIYTEDRGHLHHVLAKKGLSPAGSMLWVAALCTMTATGGTLAFIMKQAEFAIASIVMVIIVMVAGQIFGVAEFKLLTRRFYGLARSFIRPSEKPNSGIHESVVQLQGSHDWKDVWSQLVVFADTNGLNHIMLDVNAPWMHEGFHGVWRQKNANNSGNHQWLVELPMIVDGRILGRIKAFCPKDKNINHHSMVIELLDIVRGIEELLSEMHQSGEFLPKAIETASTNEVDKLVDSESIALPR